MIRLRSRDHFAELLDVLLPDGKGLAVAMQAYFDESERSNGVFAVCGFGFFKTPAKRLNKQWNRMLGDRRPFHMKELVHRTGVFKGITGAERDSLICQAAKIITKRASVSVTVLCYLDEMNSWLAPRQVAGLRHAYGFCSHIAMMGLGKWIKQNHPSEEISYFFESGHQAQGDLNRFLGLASESPEFVEVSRMRGHAFMDKADAGALQAADMLAWEAAKWWHESVMENTRGSRKSFQALILTERVQPLSYHLSGPLLEKAMKWYFSEALSEVQKGNLQIVKTYPDDLEFRPSR